MTESTIISDPAPRPPRATKLTAVTSKPEDWSPRHVRLRFELFACALALAAFSNYDVKLQPSLLIPLKIDGMPIDHLVLALAVVFIYLSVHFVARSWAEWSPVLAFQTVARESIERLEDARVGFDRSTQPLIALAQTVEETKAEVVKLLPVAKAAAENMRPPTDQEREDEIAAATRVHRGTPNDRLLVGHTEIMSVIRKLDDKVLQLEKAVETVREYDTAANAAEALERTSKEISVVIASFRRARSAIGIERIGLSLVLPAAVSLGLFAMSIQTIWRSFQEVTGL